MTEAQYKSTVRCFKVAVLFCGVSVTCFAFGGLFALMILQAIKIFNYDDPIFRPILGQAEIHMET